MAHRRAAQCAAGHAAGEQGASGGRLETARPVFSVNYRGKEYFARYQFDALYQPLAVIKDILAAFGEVADPWTLAAWFHFPSPWLVRRDERGAAHMAPKDALDRRDDVVRAAAQRLTSYAA